MPASSNRKARTSGEGGRGRLAPSSVCAALLPLLLAGCASEGPLRPPSLKLPAAVTHLTAARTGNAVDLGWTTPSKTTDGVSLTGKHGAGPLVAEVCRDVPPTASTTCAAPERIAVSAGAPGSFHDVLPADLVAGPLRPLRYRVRILNGLGKGAKSTEAETLAGQAPPAVRGLAAAPVGEGVALRWQPDPAAGSMRTYLQVERLSPATSSQPAGSRPHSELLAVEPGGSDPGGALDTGARAGIGQRYTVYRTQTVRMGANDLAASSLPATVTVAATAKAPPPGPPTGFEALVSTLSTPEVDLVWQPAEGAAGYLVFRAEGDGPSLRLTPQPLPGLSYSDTTVRRGIRYRYRVASVDASGASGPAGPELTETVPPQ